MRHWTRASFDAAATFDGFIGCEVVWLASAGGSGRQGRARASSAPSPRGAAAKAARVTSVVGFGCMAATLSAGAALAPVSSAQAAIGTMSLSPAPAHAAASADIEGLAVSGWASAAAAPEILQRREIDEFLSVGGRSVPRQIVQAIIRAAADTGVDPIYLVTLADTESSFRADVKASTSSAVGLFQFIDRTWLEAIRSFGPQHGLEVQAAAIQTVDERPIVTDDAMRTAILELRRDPFVAAVMAAELLKRDAAMIGFRIGRQISQTEMYLAHFLGLEEAAKFITMRSGKGRDASAMRAFPAAARANTAIFFERGRRGRRARSISAVYAKLDGMIGHRLSRYQDVAAVAAATGAS